MGNDKKGKAKAKKAAKKAESQVRMNAVRAALLSALEIFPDERARVTDEQARSVKGLIEFLEIEFQNRNSLEFGPDKDVHQFLAIVACLCSRVLITPLMIAKSYKKLTPGDIAENAGLTRFGRVLWSVVLRIKFGKATAGEIALEMQTPTDRAEKDFVAHVRRLQSGVNDIAEANAGPDVDEAVVPETPETYVQAMVQTRELIATDFLPRNRPLAAAPKQPFGPAVEPDPDAECSICSDGFSAQAPCIKTACGHEFHTPCLVAWARTCRSNRRKPTCPMCRGDVKASSA